MKKATVLILMLLTLSMTACSGLQVKEHETWSGVNSYELTDGDISVRYYKSSCPFPKETLEAVIKEVQKGFVIWELMNDRKYRDLVLKEQCAKQIILHAVKKE